MTFSIVCMNGKSLGVGVVSGSLTVRDRVPWVEEGGGAIATQGYTETMYGKTGLKLLRRGLSPKEILRKLTRRDSDPEVRQVAILSESGKKAIHTGYQCPRESNSSEDSKCVAIGNMLKKKETVPSMITAFKGGGRSLSHRVIRALEAGAMEGGDRRGNRTAAIVVRGKENIDIGIDSSDSPIEDLKKSYKKRIN